MSKANLDTRLSTIYADYISAADEGGSNAGYRHEVTALAPWPRSKGRCASSGSLEGDPMARPASAVSGGAPRIHPKNSGDHGSLQDAP